MNTLAAKPYVMPLILRIRMLVAKLASPHKTQD